MANELSSRVTAIAKAVSADLRDDAITRLKRLNGYQFSVGRRVFTLVATDDSIKETINAVVDRYVATNVDYIDSASVDNLKGLFAIGEVAVADRAMPEETAELEESATDTDAVTARVNSQQLVRVGMIGRTDRGDAMAGDVISFPSAIPGTKPVGHMLPHAPVPLMSGVSFVFGGTGAGKTTYLWEKSESDVIIRLGERTESWDYVPGVYHANGFFDALNAVIVFAAFGLRPALDSVRLLTYELEGNAGEKGITNSIMTVSTNLNNIISALGSHAYIVMNPQADQSLLDSLYDKLAGSVGSVVMFEDRQVARSTYITLTGRVVDAEAEGDALMTPLAEDPTDALVGRASGEYKYDSASGNVVKAPRGAEFSPLADDVTIYGAQTQTGRRHAGPIDSEEAMFQATRTGKFNSSN